jgi:hypothetical protein
MGDVWFLVLNVSEENLKVDFGLVEFKFDSLERYEDLFLSCWNCTVVVLDVSDFFICDFCQDVFADFWVHFHQLVLDKLIDS